MPVAKGTVVSALIADGEGFATRAVERLDLTFEGIAGDAHAGWTRKAGGREPWYPRGTLIRNDRQVSLVSRAELEEIARRLDLPEVRAEWIGANLVLDGIGALTQLPAGARLTFSSGAVLTGMGENMPCRQAGAGIARHAPGREGVALAFPKVAKGLRGLIAAVELPGAIACGDTVTIRR